MAEQQHAAHVIDWYLWRALHTESGKLLIEPAFGYYSMATFRDLDAEEEARDGWAYGNLHQ